MKAERHVYGYEQPMRDLTGRDAANNNVTFLYGWPLF
jgi:hypothetical protein